MRRKWGHADPDIVQMAAATVLVKSNGGGYPQRVGHLCNFLAGEVMRIRLALDEDLLRRLPLPLAQLYRRAHNTKTPFEQFLTAYYLWEAALKLLGAVAIV